MTGFTISFFIRLSLILIFALQTFCFYFNFLILLIFLSKFSFWWKFSIFVYFAFLKSLLRFRTCVKCILFLVLSSGKICFLFHVFQMFVVLFTKMDKNLAFAQRRKYCLNTLKIKGIRIYLRSLLTQLLKMNVTELHNLS